jgi:hypothetical protein
MSAATNFRGSRFAGVLVGIVLALASLSAAGHEAQQTTPEPGFRPPGHDVQAFLGHVGDMSVDVLPTMVRRVDRTAHSFASQRQIVDFLNENRIATATARRDRIDLGALERSSQWVIFQQGLSAVTETVANRAAGADYTLVMEILVPGDEAVFGVEVYIVDAQGENAFSFLLNSHHRMFAEARLTASGSSEAARQQMITNATRLGLLALQAQIQGARECMLREEVPVPRASAGTLHDFDAPLATGTDEWGTPLGYSAFSGPDTRVSFAATDAYPARAGIKGGNHVLRLDLDVSSWGGVIHRFAYQAVERWTPHDWHLLDGFSFWFHGTNSGAEVFFDILDNRNPCSKTDDAERFRYRFSDDVAGWRLIKVRFRDLAREDVFDGAPNDGLGLTKVHGWGLGTSATDGPVTFLLDDFGLLDDASEAIPPNAVRIAHERFVETRLDEDTSRIEISTATNGRLVVEKVLDLECACARLTLDRGFEYFRIDEREKLSEERARFRLTFFRQRPTGIPVQGFPAQPGSETMPVDMSAAMRAEDYLRVCRP